MWEIPDLDYTVKKIYENFDSTDFIRKLYKAIKNNSWEKELYIYFSEIYEELFANLVLKKTFISNDTKKMLETLAMPIYKKDDSEKSRIYEKIEKV